MAITQNGIEFGISPTNKAEVVTRDLDTQIVNVKQMLCAMSTEDWIELKNKVLSNPKYPRNAGHNYTEIRLAVVLLELGFNNLVDDTHNKPLLIKREIISKLILVHSPIRKLLYSLTSTTEINWFNHLISEKKQKKAQSLF